MPDNFATVRETIKEKICKHEISFSHHSLSNPVYALVFFFLFSSVYIYIFSELRTVVFGTAGPRDKFRSSFLSIYNFPSLFGQATNSHASLHA